MSVFTDPTGRFTSRADDYLKWRPGYPADVVEFWCDRFGWRPGTTVVDLGSGTGIMSELLLNAGLHVMAVEPNADMRDAAERLLGAHPQFESVAGSAEATNLSDNCADGAVAAQAFHWFDPQSTRRELLRVLRSPGQVGIVWNVRQMDSTPFLRAYEGFLHEWGTDYAAVQAKQAHPEDSLNSFFLSSSVESATFENSQSFGYEGLEGRLLSCSYVPGSTDARFKPMLTALRELFAKHEQSGTVTFHYDVRVYAGKLG